MAVRTAGRRAATVVTIAGKALPLTATDNTDVVMVVTDQYATLAGAVQRANPTPADRVTGPAPHGSARTRPPMSRQQRGGFTLES